MAPRQKTLKATGTALVNWDEELARQATEVANMEASTGGGNFFSLQGGILSFNGTPLENNQMAVVIADYVMENVFYEGRYDPNTPSPPMCYAFGRDEKSMEPHRIVVEASNHQHDTCAGCPNNEWGSADEGRGKACRNIRRLALVPAGALDKDGRFTMADAEYLQSATFGFLKLPVTSVKGFAAFVKTVSGALKRPPHGIFTRVRIVPDASNQFKVVFEPLSPVPASHMGIVMQRHAEAKSLIEQSYPLPEDAPPPPPPRSRGKVRAPVAKSAARGRA